ncbi:MAG: YeiH family protein [Pseudomonadota bacterium]|nr:YeiH family protein [Pseudomonadota bacterium]
MSPGVLLAGVLATASMQLANLPQLKSTGIGALTLAIVLGIVVGNTCYARIAGASQKGVAFSRQGLLRLGIILYGLRLTFQDIAHVGLTGVVIDALMLASTFCLAWLLGVKLFKLDQKVAMLIGAGSAICGAAAIMAAEPIIKGRAEQVSVAVSTVVVFGTLAIFLYPALYHLNAHLHWFNVSVTAYGIFAGSTIHEVAQVVAAGNAISDDAAATAVIAKMVRVMMLAPFLVILSAYLSRSTAANKKATNKTATSGNIVIPWFAVLFVAVAGLNSLAILPKQWVASAVELDTILLAMAMAALGLTTHLSAIRKAGVKPLLLAAMLFGWLVAGGLGINSLVGRLLG